MAGPERLRALYVLSSSNQLYSGIGRNLFELSARLEGRVAYEFAIDDGDGRNRKLAEEYCERRGIPLHVGRGMRVRDCLDFGNRDLPALLMRGEWDLIECLSWANAATNATALDHADDAVVAYTPHFQPSWTVPMSAREAARIERVHRAVLARADVVFCDSPWERDHLRADVADPERCAFLAVGCTFDDDRPGPVERAPTLLFIGDLAEPRKRFDRVLDVLAKLLERRPDARLVVIGNRSDSAPGVIPRSLRAAIELRGFVPEDELRRAYAESHGLILLSDFEAFGVPILEALARGTPAFLSEQPTTRGLFARYRGAHFCPPDDPEATAAHIAHTFARGRDAIAECLDDRPALRASFDWDGLALLKWQALSSAWFWRRSWSWSA
ncbi:MAG TPA: glycosyltransferase family 4 protein [Isosphaeraceae bacterium]|jgi:glycosyltransferase involved in cell wall biosynthesis|nr:glycosyltransferase family 4 protein [Isosphaeraceae bacterium]